MDFSNSIDVTIFMSLNMTRTCQERLGRFISPLFLGNVGLGKSTAVKMWCDIHGYEMVLLRISNETPDTLTGYDIAANTNDATVTSAKHIRPSWFQKTLNLLDEGKKVLLFFDEITVADSHTQGAALNIIFDRKCHDEFIGGGSNVILCAAGNYADNLSSEMEVIAPMLNRFFIVNLVPQASDLKHFLCKYKGSMTGNRINLYDELKKASDALEEGGIKNISDEQINKIGEILESAIEIEAGMQIREGINVPSVTELKDIYSGNQDNEGMGVPNIATFRTLCYLIDAAVACYINYGKSGLTSNNFQKVVHGTVGLALSRGNNDELKKEIVTNRYMQAIADAANDIEKMSNDLLPQYHQFFCDILETNKDDAANKPIDDGNIIAMTKKIESLVAEKDLANIDRPLDDHVIEVLGERVVATIRANQLSIDDGDKIKQDLVNNPDKFVKYIALWNNIAGLMRVISNLVNDPNKHYGDEIKNTLETVTLSCKRYQYNLKTIRKTAKRLGSPAFDIMPEINPIEITN